MPSCNRPIDWSDYLTQTEIVQRGWTRTMIKKLLGKADRFKPIYRYGSTGGWIHLYYFLRVIGLESTEEFKREMEISQRRSRGQIQARERRRQAANENRNSPPRR